MNSDDFKHFTNQVYEWIVNYRKSLKESIPPVIPVEQPGYLVNLLKKDAPLEPVNFEETLSDYDNKIMKGVVHWNHPHFHSYFASGNDLSQILAESLSTCMSSLCSTWETNPAGTELETIMLDWVAQALGLPKKFMSSETNCVGGGLLEGSASECIFVATLAARHHTLQMLKEDNKDLHDSYYLSKLMSYTSYETHSAAEKAASMAYLPMTFVNTNSVGEMDVGHLKELIVKDVERGLIPCLVIATTGTTGMTAFDDIHSIGTMLKSLNLKYPIRFHVDGAYGGAFFVLEENAHFKRGFAEYVDSFNFNPTKQFLASFDASCFWSNDMSIIRQAISVDPNKAVHGNPRQIDYCNYGISDERRFRAIKLWFLFNNRGVNGMKDYIKRIHSMAKEMQKLIEQDERFEVANKVTSGMVVMRYKKTKQLDTTAASKKMETLISLCTNERNILVIGHAMRYGQAMMRIPINYTETTIDDIKKSWSIIQKCADKLDADCNLQADNRHLWRRVDADVFEKITKYCNLNDGWSPILRRE